MQDLIKDIYVGMIDTKRFEMESVSSYASRKFSKEHNTIFLESIYPEVVHVLFSLPRFGEKLIGKGDLLFKVASHLNVLFGEEEEGLDIMSHFLKKCLIGSCLPSIYEEFKSNIPEDFKRLLGDLSGEDGELPQDLKTKFFVNTGKYFEKIIKCVDIHFDEVFGIYTCTYITNKALIEEVTKNISFEESMPFGIRTELMSEGNLYFQSRTPGYISKDNSVVRALMEEDIDCCNMQLYITPNLKDNQEFLEFREKGFYAKI